MILVLLFIYIYIIGAAIAAYRLGLHSGELMYKGIKTPPYYVLRSLLSWYTVVMIEEEREGGDRYDGENKKWIEIYKKVIIRRDEDGEPYLIRRTILTLGSWFSIKYHQILLSDDFCPHDHPWGFITIILKGGYYEWTPIEQKDSGVTVAGMIGVDGDIEVKKWHGAGSIMYRPATWKHRLELKVPIKYVNGRLSDDPIIAHTLVFTGRVVRDWGFFTKSGWIFWKNYNKKRDC